MTVEDEAEDSGIRATFPLLMQRAGEIEARIDRLEKETRTFAGFMGRRHAFINNQITAVAIWVMLLTFVLMTLVTLLLRRGVI